MIGIFRPEVELWRLAWGSSLSGLQEGFRYCVCVCVCAPERKQVADLKQNYTMSDPVPRKKCMSYCRRKLPVISSHGLWSSPTWKTLTTFSSSPWTWFNGTSMPRSWRLSVTRLQASSRVALNFLSVEFTTCPGISPGFIDRTFWMD
jgi:hypothetical protein